MTIAVRVPLKARPQGSKRHVGGGRMIEMAGEELKMYRASLAFDARRAMRGAPPITGPVAISAVFVMRRPKTHFNRNGLKPDAPRFCYPCQRGDLDKLMRATNDGLAGVAYANDAQIVSSTEIVMWGAEYESRVTIHPLEDDDWFEHLAGAAA